MDKNHFQDLGVEPQLRRQTEGTTGRQPTAQPARRTPAGRSLGLCMNCENRFSCTFPVPEGGVWHCEEYK